jgi:hypothetical protein
VRVHEDDAQRVERLLGEASDLLGPGLVLLQIWSSPLVEWVFIGIEDGQVVVSDNGETFAWVSGVRRTSEEYLPWSIEQASAAGERFGVDVRDESEDGSTAFRLARVVQRGESIAEVVQAVAQAIDGALALHTRPDSPTRDGYFWSYDEGTP